MAVSKKPVAKKFSEAADKKQDAKAMKGMSLAQKASFKKADMKMDKGKGLTKSQDIKKDTALAKKIKRGK